jgi:hypothetical protein
MAIAKPVPRHRSLTGVNDELRAELLRRADDDQRARQALSRSRERSPEPGEYREIPDEVREMLRIDEANTSWLTELTATRGWPGRTLAGKDGAHAAWLLAQHADPQSQRTFLDLLRAAVAAGEADERDLAYLEDRVRMHAGQPQRYGTQFISDAQGLRVWTVEDPQNLDRRRASVGLGPFADYEDLMRRA